MGGQAAARGFEYQFLCTLEYALAAIADDDGFVTGVRIEGPAFSESGADPEVVDFAVVSGAENLVVVQVKSGGLDSSLTANDLMVVLVRLLEHSARRYLVITNRAGAQNLLDLLALIHAGGTEIREDVLILLRQAKIAEVLRSKGREFWERLGRTEVVLDPRDVEQVREDVRERVRASRHRLAPSTIGWDATGLLTGYLVWEVLAKAAGRADPELTVKELSEALLTEPETFRGLLHERDWAVHVPAGPRTTDIARPELLARIAEHLPTPVRTDAAPVCVLTGLSGIGKSSLATAWADDRADAYAVILWVDATGPAQIEVSFAVIAEWFQPSAMSAGLGAGLPVRDRVFAALARTAKPWLMVFDNCADQTLVRPWIPRRGRGHTIVTSTDQNRISGPAIATIEVVGMTDDEAIHLLARRVLGNREPHGEEHELLGQLAHRLHRWPLALELCAAYLHSTLLAQAHDLPHAIAQYEKLLLASMDDAPSVPLGYPETVVGAIALTWQRVVARIGPAETIAAMALRSAAFLASRQIPLHLLVASWAADITQFSQDQARDGIPAYRQDDPPIGEVLRALKRDSLVRTDEPFALPAMHTDSSAVPLSYTITMNDVVQRIVQRLVDREGKTWEIVSRLAYCTQAWMLYYSENHQIHQIVGVLGHGVELSEHALGLDRTDNGIALLWGNTASTLVQFDEWAGAVRYFGAELSYLDSVPNPDLLLRAHTLSSLASALYGVVDHPGDAVNDIVPLLERFIGGLREVAELSDETAALTIRQAWATANSLRNHGAQHPRLADLESALNALRQSTPAARGVNLFDELIELNAMFKQGKHKQVRGRAEALLARMNPAQGEYPRVLRIMAEACISLRDWPAAIDIVARFTSAALSNTLSRFDAAALLRNVGSACIFAMAAQEEEAFGLFRTINYIAEITDTNTVAIQAGDRDVIAVLRALCAYLDGDESRCAAWLGQVDLDNITDVEQTGYSKVIYRLLRNWNADGVRKSGIPRAFIQPTCHSAPSLGVRMSCRGSATLYGVSFDLGM